MATPKEKARQKVEQRRRLTMFFNKDARKSAADALKKVSWMLAATNAYLGFAKGSVAYLVIVMVGWFVAQALAVILLSIEEDKGSQEPQEQQDGNAARLPRRRTQS